MRIHDDEIAAFFEELSLLLTSNVTIQDALLTIQRGAESGSIRTLIAHFLKEMENGQSFSQSLANYPQYIPLFISDLIAQAKTNDELTQTLDHIVTYYDSIEINSFDITKRVFASLSYFIILFIIILSLITFVSTYSLPMFDELLMGFDSKLPAVSQFFVDASHFIQAYGIFILLIVVISLAAMFIFRQRISLYCPILGSLYHKVALIRFLRTTAFMLTQQNDVAKAIKAAAQSARNRVYRRRLQRVHKALSDKSLSQGLQHCGFPKKLIYLAEIGEKSGHLSELFNRQAKLYTKQIQLSLEPRLRLMTLLITIFLGCLIALTLVAMYSPIIFMVQ